jgi:HK97 family phage prohead protease
MPDAPKALLTRAVSFDLDERAKADGDGFTLEGYAAVFNRPTRIDSWEGTFDETIAPGAFAKTIRERTPVIQFDHGHDIATGSVPIASVDSISEDKRGLFVSARMFDNPRVEPIRQAIAGGAIDGMSFRFRVVKEEWDESDDIPLRTIREVELFELGPVVFPAYDATSVGVRSLLAELDDTQRTRLLADLGAATRHSEDAPPAAAHTGTPGSAGTDPRAVLTLAAALRAKR